MTKAERSRIERAIGLLMSDEGFTDGMEILCHLIGWEYPAAKAAREGKPINLWEFSRRHRKNRTFQYRPKGG